MLATLSLVILLAEPSGGATMPRRADTPTAPPPVDAPRTNDGPFESADPLFDKPLSATDDPAFVASAVESGRQAVLDTKAAAAGLPSPELRGAATVIETHQRATLGKIEAIAKKKGWQLPPGNPDRTASVVVSDATRTSANFIVHQIAAHQQTVAQFRAQIAGKGDAELKRALREALPGYQKNLQMLLGLKL